MSNAPQNQRHANLEPRHAKTPAQQDKGRKRSIVILSVILALLLCGVAAGVGYMLWQQSELNRVAEEMRNTPVPEPVDKPAEGPAEEAPADDRVENPIDFASLKLENPDIYAWIYVPGTDVNLPVLQSATNDFLYLDHNKDGEYAVEGAIYTEMANSTDFTDPVTLIYGHNLQNGTMFSTLHYFENEEFFAEHEDLLIYTPGHVLTYRIVSAYLYDDRHILNSYDFSDPDVLQGYLDSVMNPDSLLVNVRSDTELSIDDRIVQLSTCMSDTSHTTSRYIVTGVLIDDQPTY
ncbi:class B sortase [Arabiibacter massiliensis]|uniref:class B sortase n=1 Tax=Arabiibacter massiliensis TaxID=1870985 RepID=UPI00155A6C3A|nr:class B sortase [Arabiibacter massiliensis]